MKKQLFERVFKSILELEDVDPLLRVIARKKSTSVLEVIEYSKSTIEKLDTLEADGSIKEIPLHSKSLIKILKSWDVHLIAQQGLRRVDWFDESIVNIDEFGDFRAAIYDPDAPLRSITRPTTTSSVPYPVSLSTLATSSSKYTPADEFLRGVKRDKMHSLNLKDEKQWDKWKRATISTIYAHGYDNIISPAYIPMTPNDINLFREQNKFMYDVFLAIMKTPMGKHFM
jgi:hypothetical protein